MKFVKGSIQTALVLASLIGGAAFAAGPTGWGGGSCMEVTAFPVNITAPGVYCLSFKHIDFPMTTGALIKISSNDVVFDMNGATLDGTVSNNVTTSAWGVLSTGYSNITIRNGTIKGFMTGIHLESPTGTVNSKIRTSHTFTIENVRLINNRSKSIYVNANDVLIQNNHITHTGGSADPNVGGEVMGMFLAGNGHHVVNNDIGYTVPNTVYPGATYGIYTGGLWNSIITNNRISESNFGIYGPNNFGKYRDNITVSVATPYTGGTNIGNNN